MTQEIHYNIKFSFPAEVEDREKMLPAVDMFLRALEDADRMMAGALGLEMDYHRALKEMGESHFFYTVGLRLKWPRQILLGSWPEPESLRKWMGKARSDLFTNHGRSGVVSKIAERWDAWAKEDGLAEALVYSPPAEHALDPLLDDLNRALIALGGAEAVELD